MRYFKSLSLFIGILYVNQLFGAAPPGEWWNNNYSYRRILPICAQSVDVPTEYSVKYEFDHATLVNNGQSLSNGDDIRIVYWNGSSWEELDRVCETNWNTETTEIWFKTKSAINANQCDDNYYMYYGYSSATSPPANRNNIYLFWDDFDEHADGDDPDGWTDYPSANGDDWQVTTESGNKCFRPNGSVGGNPPTTYSVAGNSSWDNYSYSAKVMRDNIGTNWGGIVFHWQGRNSYYVFTWRSNWWLKLARVGTGSWSEDKTSGITFNANQWYDLEVRFYNGEIEGYVDGVLQLSHTDASPIPNGEIGGYGNWERTFIDEVKVRKYVNPEPTICECVVTNTNNSGPGSLRNCIEQENSNSGEGTIVFNIPTSDPNYDATTGTWTIRPTSELPALSDATGGTFIDGSTQASFIGGDPNPDGPEIIIDGSNAGAGSNGFEITSNNNKISTLVINNFDGCGVRITGDTNEIVGNYIGVNYSGSTAAPNNNEGIYISGSSNTIGGTSSGARNIISGNDDEGIYIGGASAVNNKIIGNYIGTDRTGTKAIANESRGILIYSEANNNIIGGTTDAERNIISGNEDTGIQISGSAHHNYVLGNYIGLKVNGTEKLPNDIGIRIQTDADSNVIGKNASGVFKRNVISGNNREGIRINSGPNNIVVGNYIGLSADGTTGIPNRESGIVVYGNSNIIGGVTADDRNVISGNERSGIFLGGDTNKVIGNYIGVDASGDNSLPNYEHGIRIYDGASSNIIGGTTSDSTNRIWYNNEDGISVEGSDSDYNRFSRNSIQKNGDAGIDLAGGGANEDISPPTINSITKTGASTYDVNISVTTLAGSVVEVFSDESNEGKNYKNSYTTTSDNETFTISITENNPTLNITATVTDPTGNTSEFSEPMSLPPETGFYVTTTRDTVDGDTSSITNLVADKGADGEISLREAIIACNNTTGLNVIHFNIPTTDGGYNSAQGTWTITLTDTLPWITDDEGVYINGFSQSDSNPYGPDIIINAANVANGKWIFNINYSYHNIISGLTLNGNNNVDGFYFYHGDTNTVKGCYIGTNYNATSASALRYGINLYLGSKNTIGGVNPEDRNIISGNSMSGICIYDANGNDNKIIGNYIGTNRYGSGAIPNGTGGGIRREGIYIYASNATTIGGIEPGAGNVISGNTSHGIHTENGRVNILGNFIGTNSNGTSAIANGAHGIRIYSASSCTIGGTNVNARNIISGNNGSGIYLSSNSASNNVILGNYIGTNASGTSAIPNASCGIYIRESKYTTIGGTEVGAGNLISGNGGGGTDYDGIRIEYNNAVKNKILGNKIGTDVNGTSAIPNGGSGVYIYYACSTIIGGTASGAGNIIAYNLEDGITIVNEDADYNLISRNSIFENTLLGIDIVSTLANEGVSPPTITTINDLGSGNWEVTGTAGSNHTIELFLASSDGEGKTYLGTTTADASGNWTVTISASGGELVATATTTNNSTSEFSVSSPFAIEILSFSGYSEAENIVLSWQIENELNIKEFIIERTNEQIAKVEPKGINSYVYIDSNVIVGQTYDYRLGKVSSHNDTIWYGPIKIRVIGLKEYPFSLHQSIPMPFHTSTIIVFSVPGKSGKKKVKLEIYDITGRLIKTLVNSEKKPGYYTVSWNGRDNENKQVGSGIYLYRLKIGPLIKCKKMICMKKIGTQ